MGPDTPLYHFGPTAQILLLGALITAACRAEGQRPCCTD